MLILSNDALATHILIVILVSPKLKFFFVVVYLFCPSPLKVKTVRKWKNSENKHSTGGKIRTVSERG